MPPKHDGIQDNPETQEAAKTDNEAPRSTYCGDLISQPLAKRRLLIESVVKAAVCMNTPSYTGDNSLIPIRQAGETCMQQLLREEADFFIHL